MKIHNTLMCSAAAAALLALSGCVTQATQPTAAAPAAANTTTAAAPSLASTATSVLGSVLQANGGAAGLMTSLGVPASSTPSNAAGVLTYCAKNNYLSADKAGSLASQLLTSLGLPTDNTSAATAQDAGYAQGIAGMIIAPNGTLFSMDQIKGNVKDKACEFVLNNASNFLPK